MATSLIGLTGHERPGTDATAHLVTAHGHTRLVLAGPVRDILLAVDPFLEGSQRRIRDDDSGTVPKKATDESQRLINAFSGEISRRGLLADPQDGRIRLATEAVRFLNPFCVPAHRSADADLLSTHLAAVDGDWSRLDDPTAPAHREFHRLHRILRTEAGSRIEQFGDDLWIHLALTTAGKADGPVAITGVRLGYEAEAIREAGGTIISVHRPPHAHLEDALASETGISTSLVDTTIVDDGPLEQLHALIDAVVGTPALAA